MDDIDIYKIMLILPKGITHYIDFCFPPLTRGLNLSTIFQSENFFMLEQLAYALEEIQLHPSPPCITCW